MKMRRIFLSLFMACALVASALTDQQVIDYIKKQTAAGKSEQQIGKELLAKGVTPNRRNELRPNLRTYRQNLADLSLRKVAT